MSWMDFKTAQALQAQKLNSYSKQNNVAVQKGTGEKPHQDGNTVVMKTALCEYLYLQRN